MDCWALKIVSMYQTVFLRSSFFISSIFLFSCSTKKQEPQLPYYNTAAFTITQADIEGKIHVANFIFTRCGSICPIMTKHMKLVQNAFQKNDDVVMLSYSVTPWLDSVARLKDYANNNAITSPNWHLLTGNKGDIYTLARQSYFAEEDLGFTKDSTDFLHTEHILLVDKTKRIRGIYNGTLQLEIEQMIKDIQTLLLKD
jgi:protein SCO1